MDEITPFATATDLGSRWRPLTPAEMETAGVLLADASQMIVDEAGGVPAVPPRTLERIVCSMVKRAMSGPFGADLGVESTQVGAGPFQETLKFANPMGDLYLTKAERRALGIGRSRAFEVDLLPPGAEARYGVHRDDVPEYLGWLP